MRLHVTPLRRLWRDTRGAAALEFGILLPVFIPLVLGIMQFGQLFWTQTALQHAVDMAARCATVDAATCGSTSSTQTYAATQAYGLTFPNGTFVATAAACGNQVTATYTFPFMGAAWFSAASVNLSAQSCYPV